MIGVVVVVVADDDAAASRYDCGSKSLGPEPVFERTRQLGAFPFLLSPGQSFLQWLAAAVSFRKGRHSPSKLLLQRLRLLVASPV